MRSYNVLVIGEGLLLSNIKGSKYLNKLYTTSSKEYENIFSLEFVTFRELVEKCKKLQIDLVIIEDTKLIKQGIVDVLKFNHINCIAPNLRFIDLVSSNIKLKQFLNKYNIPTPLVLPYPKEFPLYVKANGFCEVANSMQDVLDIKQKISKLSSEIEKTIFLEQYLKGDECTICSLFDGNKLLTFPFHNAKNADSINLYTKTLEQALIQEGFNFIGFINSKLQIINNVIYNTDIDFQISSHENKYDLLYIFILAIYQKLDEFMFNN